MYDVILTAPTHKRIYKLLKDGREHTTREIVRKCNVCCVNTYISEMRSKKGIPIKCDSKGFKNGAHIYAYQIQF